MLGFFLKVTHSQVTIDICNKNGLVMYITLKLAPPGTFIIICLNVFSKINWTDYLYLYHIEIGASCILLFIKYPSFNNVLKMANLYRSN
ncbi:Hypothetical protein SRAE_X000013800 [Strongyloides ratti]|uniref:Uncharacterized protein n=1 Tax=Strongyloides ratti TaxID=34506 RepID=A0A090LRK9_STRRB|nr:Hypothetical protein SRAE_X000013800 [Strongyloides ratti]CEF70807.1 Hypothetical protein SRAE_X000013800 [Strongyloides ratti]